MTADELKAGLERWAAGGDVNALTPIVRRLSQLRVSPWVEECFSAAELEELRADVLIALLRDGAAGLRDADRPFAYVRRALSNRARSLLRRKVLDEQLPLEDKQAITIAAGEADPLRRLEAEESLAHAFQELSPAEREALLLFHAPERLTSDEWKAIAQRHPPPPPARPQRPVSREELGALLHPRKPPEQAYDAAARALHRGESRLRKRAMDEHSDEEQGP